MKNIVETIDPNEVYDAMHQDKVLKKAVENPHDPLTMDDQYGDGSDHEVCGKCGYCDDCGDCDQFGCGTTRSHPEEFDRDETITMLKHDVCEVQFTKTDGSVRNMVCTLKEEYLPPQKAVTKEHAINTEIIKVFDLEKESWRSFRVDSMKSIVLVR